MEREEEVVGLFSWFADRAHLGITRAVTRQIVHILWNNYKTIEDASLSEAEKWQLAVASRLTARKNRDGLLMFEGAKPSITDFEKACSFVCEVEIRQMPPILDGEASMKEFAAIHDTIREQIARIQT